MSTIYDGTIHFDRLYTMDTLTTSSFGGSGTSNTMLLTGLSQVDSSAVDYDAEVVDEGDDGFFNADDTVTTTFPGDTTTTVLTRVDTSKLYGSAASGFASGYNDYAIFVDSSGQMYILFSSSFDLSALFGGELTITEDEAAGNLQISDILCFVGGTMISTDDGERPVEALQVGDTLKTNDGKTTKIHWISHTHLNAEQLSNFPKMRPVRIKANAFAKGAPNQDLMMSRQHRVMLKSVIAHRMTGHAEVLVPIHAVSNDDTIIPEPETAGVTYYHILTDQHDVIIANGLPCESLHIGAHLQKTVGPDRYKEICNLVADGQVSTSSSHPILQNKQARNLVARIVKNEKPLLDDTFIPGNLEKGPKDAFIDYGNATLNANDNHGKRRTRA